jgi:succinoglycan biosynthesis transport protein ExoP
MVGDQPAGDGVNRLINLADSGIGGMEPGGSDELDLRSALGLLRRQFRLILVTVFLVLAVAGAAIVVMKPLYTATALILVDPSRKNLLDPDIQTQSGSSDGARVESEVELVKSETTLLRAIDELDLIADAEFGVRLGFRDILVSFLRIGQPVLPTGDAALQDVLSNVRDAISVQRRGLTYLISVQARSLDPQKAADLANEVAHTYIVEQLEAKVASTLASRDIINARIEAARGEVELSEGAFDGFIETHIEQITRDTGRSDLAVLRLQLEQANVERARLSSAANLVGSSLERRDWVAISAQLKTEAIAQLEAQRQGLQTTLAGLTDGTQQAIDLKAELTKLEADMQDAAEAELTTMRQQVASAQARSTELRGQLRSGVLQSDLPAALLTNIYELQQNAELARTQYQTLLSRTKDLEVQASLQVPDSRVVSVARAPTEPSFPNPRLILGVAGIVALGLGIGLAFLAENFVGGFSSEEQMRSVLRATTVVSVPKQRSTRAASAAEAAGWRTSSSSRRCQLSRRLCGASGSASTTS